MKTYEKNSTLLITLLLFGLLPVWLQAQPKEKIEAQRIAFITNQLDLTPAEAQVFWPVYNEYDKKRQELNRTFRKEREDDPDLNAITEKEALEIADNQLVEAQKMLDLRKEYHNKFKSVLPPKKLLKLYDSEREFQKHLLNRLKEGKGAGQGDGYQRRAGNRYGAPNK